MIKMIGAISLDRAIGVYEGKKGKLPWGYEVSQGDLQHFHNITKGHIVIMGRKTWESIGSKPLPDRYNIVVSRKKVPGAIVSSDLNSAIQIAKGMRNAKNIFLIGGRDIFKDGQKLVDEIILTIIPYKAYDHHSVSKLVYFPRVNTKIFKNRIASQHPINPQLRIITYRRWDFFGRSDGIFWDFKKNWESF